MSISDQVTALQARLRTAKDQHARASVRAETAAEAARVARENLETEFGVKSAEDAAKLLTQYQQELDAVIAALEQALGEAEQ